MSNQTRFIPSRRNFLKGVAYTSALSVGGISSLVYALSTNTSTLGDKTTSVANGDISVMQQKMLHKETVPLFNNSDKAITLDALLPVTIERLNSSLIVKPNLMESVTSGSTIIIQPRERISFDIQTTGSIFSYAEISDTNQLKGQQLHISSHHSGFNRLIPVSTLSIANSFTAIA